MDPRLSTLVNVHGTRIVWVALLAAGAWLFYPALTPVHVEGFSASIVSLALHLHGGDFASYDRVFPVNFEFFALSRLGTVAFVSTLVGWLALSGEWAMRATMWIGLAGLATASFLLVRRWTGCSAALAVASLLLIPGIAESTFFYNDNVLSAALATGALAVVASSTGLARTALAGVMLGAGIVARMDAVLLAPAVVLIAYDQHGLGRTFAWRAFAFAAGVMLPVIAVPASVHATILDGLHVSSYVVVLWNRPLRLAQQAGAVSFFIGLPAALFAAFGVLHLVKRREVARLLLLLGVPLLFNLAVLGKLWESRQLLPLSPFIAALVVLGWNYLTSADGWAERRNLRWIVGAISVVAVLSPIGAVFMSDGPRSQYGRLWSPLRWTRWQTAVRTNFDDMRHFAASLDTAGDASRPVAVITDGWDADRYFHLAMQESGYSVADAASVGPACPRAGELFARGPRRVLHVRLHQPFLRAVASLAMQRLDAYGTPCLQSAQPSAEFLMAPRGQLEQAFRGDLAPNEWLGRVRADSARRRSAYDPQVAVRVGPPSVDTLRSVYASAASFALREWPAGDWDRDLRLPRVEQLMAPRVWPRPR